MADKNILVLNGGATRGLIQVACLAEVEARTGKRIHELFDLIVATSVGAITGSMLAAGVAAKDIEAGMLSDRGLSYMFEPRTPWNPMNWFRFKYRRSRVMALVEQSVPNSMKMRELLVPVVLASWNINTQAPIFFKSYNPKYADLPVNTVIPLCFAAPIYFGFLSPSWLRNTVSDAGLGGENSPVDQAYQEIIRLGWFNESTTETVSLTVIGSGHCIKTTPFEETRNWGFVKQTVASLGVSLSEAITEYQINCMNTITSAFPARLKFNYVDTELDVKDMKFGIADSDTLGRFQTLGHEMGQKFRIDVLA